MELQYLAYAAIDLFQFFDDVQALLSLFKQWFKEKSAEITHPRLSLGKGVVRREISQSLDSLPASVELTTVKALEVDCASNSRPAMYRLPFSGVHARRRSVELSMKASRPMLFKRRLE